MGSVYPGRHAHFLDIATQHSAENTSIPAPAFQKPLHAEAKGGATICGRKGGIRGKRLPVGQEFEHFAHLIFTAIADRSIPFPYQDELNMPTAEWPSRHYARYGLI